METFDPERKKIKQILKRLPELPGVYIYKDIDGTILYVGKAKSLKKRVSSYFQKKYAGESFWLNPKVAILVSLIHDIDYIVTKNEVEALILELNLIKRHHPRFNTDLKDGKSYPYLAVSKEKFPRIFITRDLDRSKDRYFGPFTRVMILRETYAKLRKLFPFRNCRPTKFLIHQKKLKPCLDYHIHLCAGPCAGSIDEKNYKKIVDEIVYFYDGRTDHLVTRYEKEMEEAARVHRFEDAANARDKIRLIGSILQKQTAVLSKREDIDVIVQRTLGSVLLVVVMKVRAGKLIENETFELKEGLDEPIDFFLRKYYEIGTNVPKKIFVSRAPEDTMLINAYIHTISGINVKVSMPKAGEGKRLLQLAEDNLTELSRSKLESRYLRAEETIKVMRKLQEDLGLQDPPVRIECFDISNMSGKDAVASMVVMQDLELEREKYRKFKIKTKDTPDDFRMMLEAITRRLHHLIDPEEKDESLIKRPDLMIVDGGKPQLTAAVMAIQKYPELFGLQVISLAKKEEEIFFPGADRPLILPKDSQSLQTVQKIRDEAHRFAISYHKHLRDKRAKSSILDNVPGIGPTRRIKLLKKFGSLDNVREASVEELSKSLPEPIAKTLYLYLRSV